MKSVKQDQSISQKGNVSQLTPEQWEVLTDFATGLVLIPAVSKFIKVFNIPTSKQRVSERSIRQRNLLKGVKDEK